MRLLAWDRLRGAGFRDQNGPLEINIEALTNRRRTPTDTLH
jgi:hypothetical protein